MPWARMHCATVRNCASACAVTCGGKLGPPGPPGVGSSFPHLACAALNAGDEMKPALAWNANPPPGAGSGNVGTPLARMHLANANAPGGALDPVEPTFAALEPARGPVGADALAPPPDVGLELGELPPQPASKIAPTSAATASGRTRRDWFACLEW